MSNAKYDLLISSFNNERFADLEKAFSDSFHVYDLVPFITYLDQLDYSMNDLLEMLSYCHHLDIKGFLFEPLNIKGVNNEPE